MGLYNIENRFYEDSLYLSLHGDVAENGITKEAASHFFLHVLVVVRETSFAPLPRRRT